MISCQSWCKPRLVQLALALGCAALTNSAEAAKVESLAELKAAYIYNIAKFSRWPAWKIANKDSPLKLCMYGSNSVAEKLHTLHGQSIGGHKIHISQPQAESEFKQCHLLYITPEERRRYRYILTYVNQQAVVTISDDQRFIRSGGLINLAERNQRLYIEMNKHFADKQQVGFSSKLLKLVEMTDGQKR